MATIFAPPRIAIVACHQIAHLTDGVLVIKTHRMTKMHPITRYRTKFNLTLEQFGDMIGVVKSSIHRWEAGERMSAPNAVAIEKATGGAIHRSELRPDIFENPRNRPTRRVA